MVGQRLSALFFMLAGVLLALDFSLGESALALGGKVDAANRGLGPSTAFTYQGELQMDGARVSGTYDFQFSLWDAASGGSQAGSTISHEEVSVSEGRFTVLLDFGDVFDGTSYYLEIAVRPGDSSGAYTTLSPRQALTATPYASHAGSVPWAGVQDVPDGFADNVDGVEYANVIVVAKSGGDFTSIQGALNSIGDATADNPYLVWVAPGVYTEQVTLKAHVTLQGAGEGATVVRGTGGNQDPFDGPGSATLVGADNATVRHLSVDSDATGTANDYAVALYNNGTSPTIAHITAAGSGGSYSYGVYNETASPTMTNVSATASGGTNLNIGVLNYNGASPTMTNVSATGSGGASSTGVYNTSASPTMTNVSATASGSSSSNVGVANVSGASPTMTNVTATSSGGSESYGVRNVSASPTMTNVTATSSGGSESYGVRNTGSSPTIQHSKLEGDDYSIFSAVGALKVANSQLIGPVAGSVTYACFNNYDENMAAVTCP